MTAIFFIVLVQAISIITLYAAEITDLILIVIRDQVRFGGVYELPDHLGGSGNGIQWVAYPHIVLSFCEHSQYVSAPGK